MTAADTPHDALSSRPPNPFSRARMEVIASRTVAGFGIVFSLPALPVLIAQTSFMREPLGLAIAAVVYAGIIVIAICAVLQRGVRASMLTMALLFLVILSIWPLTAAHPDRVLSGLPWPWFLITVMTAYAVVAMRLGWAATYTVVAPAIYGFIRTLPSAGGHTAGSAALDAVYAVLVSGSVLVIIALLRQAASAVDAAQATALSRYADAVRQHATEVERVQVDAIVHDSVLTTLLSAASAQSPEARTLAGRMAQDAIGHLHAAEAADPEDQSAISVGVLVERVRESSASMAMPFRIVASDKIEGNVPVSVAEAMYSATVQAMVNSVQHAGDGDVERTVRIVVADAPTVTVTVADTGRGFRQEDVPAERLGVRVSIRERLEKAGGSARVESQPEHGTTVTLAWPADPVELGAGPSTPSLSGLESERPS